MIPDIEEIKTMFQQTDSITDRCIPAKERNEESHSDHSQSPTESQGLRRNPPRTRKPPTRLEDYVTYASRYPISESISLGEYSTSHAACLCEIDKHSKPRSFQEAYLLPQWNQAMAYELRALDKTWSLVQLPPGKKAIGSGWIYKIKFKTDGSIERHKARLVARGFT
ncbi:hypothetical protein ACFX2K_034874 [Malus domestica]